MPETVTGIYRLASWRYFRTAAGLGGQVESNLVAPRLFGVALALGLVMLAFLGLAMSAVMLIAGQEAWSVGEMLAGALYLFSGAIFPLDVLPAVLRPLGLVMPMTYWLEMVRRALGVSE